MHCEVYMFMPIVLKSSAAIFSKELLNEGDLS